MKISLVFKHKPSINMVFKKYENISTNGYQKHFASCYCGILGMMANQISILMIPKCINLCSLYIKWPDMLNYLCPHCNEEKILVLNKKTYHELRHSLDELLTSRLSAEALSVISLSRLSHLVLKSTCKVNKSVIIQLHSYSNRSFYELKRDEKIEHLDIYNILKFRTVILHLFF